MRIWKAEHRCEPTLIIDCDNDRDAAVLNEFARCDEPLCAKLMHGIGYKHPHLEIRKENS